MALARALAPNPRLLLLDEPLSALDAQVRTSLRSEIRALQRRLGIVTIMVTHDQEEALSMADRVVLMHDGRIEQAGTPEELYRRPRTRFVAGFVGRMNMLPGHRAGRRQGACARQRAPLRAGRHRASERRPPSASGPSMWWCKRFGDDGVGTNSFAARLLDTEFFGNRTAARLACEPLGIEIEADLPADHLPASAAGAQQHGAHPAAAARAVGARRVECPPRATVPTTCLDAAPPRRARDRDRWLAGAACSADRALLLAIVALPVGALVGQSFFDRAGAFVGLANFARYLANPAPGAVGLQQRLARRR